MNTQTISSGINDIIDIAIAIKEAAKDNKISFFEGLKIGAEVLDLKNDILNFQDIVVEWNLSSDDEKIEIALEVNKKLYDRGVSSYNLQLLIEKSINVVSAVAELINEAKKIEKKS